MSWFTGILDYCSGVDRLADRRTAVLAAAVEPLEDRRLLSVSCAPVPSYCQPRSCNDAPVLSLGRNNGCKPVCNAPTLSSNNGNNCAPKQNSCKPVEWCNGPILRNLNTQNCESDRGKNKGKDCKPQKDNCDNGGPVVFGRSENCDSNNKNSKKTRKDKCEPRRDDCEQVPSFRNGQQNGKYGKDNCRPDPCQPQVPALNGNPFCNKPCETKPNCQPQTQSSSRSSGKNDCFSKQPCKPVYCAPPPCNNVPLPV